MISFMVMGVKVVTSLVVIVGVGGLDGARAGGGQCIYIVYMTL